ncbi:MAG: family phosphatase [Paenibacillaceae bacterium]|jgi:HAD superfamily phosphatase (TIGR01668 family)|nr:family phosphatase [Paenibacillaceae bacterium]
MGLLNKLLPAMKLDSIYHLDLASLWESGIRGIITDLDNTLVRANDELATPQLLAWLKTVHEAGFRIVIVSNNHRTRVEKFAAPLSIPFIYRAKKPATFAFRKALKLMDLTSEQAIVVGDQLLTDVWGGNRLGLKTVHVQPISREFEGLATRVNRRLEKIALSLMKDKKS